MTYILFSVVIMLSFVFGLTNGFIDGGGLVSTVITTRALEPFGALMLVACGELLGLFILGQAVTYMLAQHLVNFPVGSSALQMLSVLTCALLGALIWNVSMWRLALPSSSSHALVGGLAGALICEYGKNGIAWPVFVKIFLFLGCVPLVGSVLGFLFARLTYRLGEYLTPAASGFFRFLQILSLGGSAMVHGSNDGQKCMAMMLLAVLAVNRSLALPVLPWPVVLFCGGALALGIVFGSRRIIRTLGKRLYRVESLQGVSAGTSTVLLVGLSSILGYPMSTTHVMSSSILGAGFAVQPRGVRWDLAGEMGMAWLATLPAAAVLAALIVWIMRWAWVGL
jgi:PiT family inorganic phosphate transporter